MANDKAFKVKNGLELAGYDTSKAVTAVDVFVYDTSKDSDGGAWRKRTQGTSWYNETLNTATRGARREFPAVAVIVAESNKVTIYDGDDPALPMWMVFTVTTTYNGGILTVGNSGSVTGISAINGSLVVSTGQSTGNDGVNGVFVIAFLSDSAIKYCQSQLSTTFDLDIARRNSPSGGGNDYTSGISLPRLVSNFHNDVAMTVLPDAPIDPATGLPVPTIAVATAGGVSVIKDDGAVVDIYPTSLPEHWKVDFAGEKLMMQGAYLDYSPWVVSIPDADVTGWFYNTAQPTGITLEEYSTTGSNNPSGANLRFLGATGQRNKPMVASGSARYLCTASGLSIIAANEDAPSNGMVNYITSSYQSGWQNGDIKGAFLSDTDDTDLVGSGELWNTPTISDPAVWSWDGSTLTATGDGTSATATGDAVVAGEVYFVSFTVGAAGAGLFQVRLGDTFLATLGGGANQTYSYTVVATGATGLRFTDTGSTTAVISNISAKLADADRSVNNNGLIVNGTVTRTAVATGADLVAYSGFSASNYLEQPYNSALDFGTGDFCVMGWVKLNGTTNCGIAARGVSGSTSGMIALSTANTNNTIRFDIGSAFVSSASTVSSGSWAFIVVKRESGIAYLYLNGALSNSGANTQSATNASATTKLGQLSFASSPLLGSLALFRISATAPSAEQIAKIYNDEKFLFQENAQATLYGASDAVTSLAHDDATNLLHVGTSAGRSVFSGLRRVSNTTTAVGNSISASNGLVVEE